MGVSVNCAADSSAGLVREGNEDAAYAGRWLYAVADGLGGHIAGEVASSIVIDSLRSSDRSVPAADLAQVLSRAVGEANERLRQKIAVDLELSGMGTTLTALLWSGSHVAVANIGDSRAYLMRAGRLLPITEDHTVGMLVSDAGRMAPVIARYLDGRPERSPDLTVRATQLGDRYMLCSDGLSSFVEPGTIREVLAAAPAAGDAVHHLCARAYDAGAPDNITVIVLDVTDEAVPAREPVLLGAAAADPRVTRRVS